MDCCINGVPFSVDGGGVRADDGQADDRHEVHTVQHLLQEDPRHMDRHRFYHPPLPPLLRLPGDSEYMINKSHSTPRAPFACELNPIILLFTVL